VTAEPLDSVEMLSCGFENDCLNLQLVAVAARNLEKAKEFAKRHGVKSAYGSYESIAQDSDVG